MSFASLFNNVGWTGLLRWFGEPVQLIDSDGLRFKLTTVVDTQETQFSDGGTGWTEIGYRTTMSFQMPDDANIQPRDSWIEHDGKEYLIVSEAKKDADISTFVVEWVEIGGVGQGTR